MSMIGKTLGTFECTALLGKGGMGEVYRARIRSLDATSPLKSSPKNSPKTLTVLPDFSTLPHNLHPKILEMLDRCMEIEVKNR